MKIINFFIKNTRMKINNDFKIISKMMIIKKDIKMTMATINIIIITIIKSNNILINIQIKIIIIN